MALRRIRFPKHDPGGKVRLRTDLASTVSFSADRKHRHSLSRLIDASPGSVLWIGMNPSTADEKYDDPTVRREVTFTRRWGYGTYHKCNVMDYRATSPKDLLLPGVVPCSPKNLPTIMKFARLAEIIVICYGKPPNALRHFGPFIVDNLRKAGYTLHCLGTNNDGSPKHPLYLAGDTELQVY